ncbi:hypothetical protein AT251_24450 [Enterovibrio nigricans]|nr:hypothetical protein [Enterovibrio nigricans]PKF48662.1 hypothetical protein AT251_24450 [Enterovibrio nigricans]
MACAEYLSAFNDNNAQKDTRPAICQQLDAELLAHFKDDAEGKFNNKESLLFVSTRGHSLAGILAYSKLCELAQHTDTIALSLRQASKKSDNYRLLDTLETLLDNNELPEFKHMDAKRVK